jgi:rubrerythrin/uncharacterized linocin/CFP29 family protein
MFSKNPVEITREKKLSVEELSDALRIAIAAEIDAVNLYLQFARSVEDPSVKKVFEDIADEEKVHIGEFLTMLQKIDPRQREALSRGSEEVERLIKGSEASPGSLDNASKEKKDDNKDPLNDAEKLIDKIRERIISSRDKIVKMRKILYKRVVPRGVESIYIDEFKTEGERITFHKRYPVELKRIGATFEVSRRGVEASNLYGGEPDLYVADVVGNKIGGLEDDMIINEILRCEKTLKTKISSWDEPGSAVSEIAEAVKILMSKRVSEPYFLIIGPERYVKLLRVYEKTGVLEIMRVKELVKDVIVSPYVPGDKAILMSTDPSVAELVISIDGYVDYLGPEEEAYKYRFIESLSLLIKDPGGIIVLSQ